MQSRKRELYRAARNLRRWLVSVKTVPNISQCSVEDRSFAVAGPRLWNSLPISLRQISSLGQFRRYLKNHLFGIREITAQCDVWFSALYKYSYLLTYLLKDVTQSFLKLSVRCVPQLHVANIFLCSWNQRGVPIHFSTRPDDKAQSSYLCRWCHVHAVNMWTRRCQHTQECHDPRRQCFAVGWLRKSPRTEKNGGRQDYRPLGRDVGNKVSLAWLVRQALQRGKSSVADVRSKRQYSVPSEDRHRLEVSASWAWPFNHKLNGFPGLIVEYFCIEFGDP